VYEALKCMADKKIGLLVILENGKLVRIISIGDVLNSIISDQELRIE